MSSLRYYVFHVALQCERTFFVSTMRRFGSSVPLVFFSIAAVTVPLRVSVVDIIVVAQVIKMSDAVVSGSADKRQKINKKKNEQAAQNRKYDSRHIYFGNTSDEWERQRTIFGKCHSWFARLLERHVTCLPHDAPIWPDHHL